MAKKIHECSECALNGEARMATDERGYCEKHLAVAPQPAVADSIEAVDPNSAAAYEAFMSRDGGRYSDKLYVPEADPSRFYFHSADHRVEERKALGYRVESGIKSRSKGQVVMSIPRAWRDARIAMKGKAAKQRLTADTEAALESRISGEHVNMNIPGRRASVAVTTR
jgi:hypothetical protein